MSVLPQALRELEHGHAGPVRDEGAQGAGQEAAVQAAEPVGRGELPHDRERRPPLDLRLGALLLVLRHLEPVWKSTSVSGAQFFTKSFLGDDAADLTRSSGEDPASPRHRAGAASMAWKSTR